jgi:hypothetical protein
MYLLTFPAFLLPHRCCLAKEKNVRECPSLTGAKMPSVVLVGSLASVNAGQGGTKFGRIPGTTPVNSGQPRTPPRHTWHGGTEHCQTAPEQSGQLRT